MSAAATLPGTARRSSRARSAFRPATVVGLLLVGALAFLLLLLALGMGWTGQEDRDGGAHAGSNSLNGFAGLVQLMEARGLDVSLSRSPAAFDEEALLVLTPDQFSDGEEVWDVIEGRRYVGPTLLVMPKWNAFRLPTDNPKIKSRDGWVQLGGTSGPYWLEEAAGLEDADVRQGEVAGWKGLGLTGKLPDPKQVQALVNEADVDMLPMVLDDDGDQLAGVVEDGGYYPVLHDMAGISFTDNEIDDQDDSAWPVVIVFEPDLLNNYGMADEARARLAMELVTATMDDYDLPVVFDLTLAGLGKSENLLTLAFTPPFLAATLTLLLIGLVIAWRSFRRFGAARAEQPAMAHGKTQLASNGARLLERAKRWHLLGEPYAEMVAARIASTLGIRTRDPEERAAAIDRALVAETGEPRFAAAADALRKAERPQDILRAARELRQIERTLQR